MKKIVICGGHLTPALATIEELRNKKDIEIIFFGRKLSTEGAKNFSAEYEIINNLGIKFRTISAGRLQRKFTKYTLFALAKIPLGFIQSFLFLLIERPALIVSFGGYLSLPVVVCGWLIGISSITHEQSTQAGLANKINSLFAEKVFLTWPQTQKFFPEEKSEVIGNPTRKAIFLKNTQNSKINRFLKRQQKLIAILGGNQGSHFINQKIFELLPKLNSFNIVHQVGTANYQGDFDYAKKIKKDNYLCLSYIYSKDIGAILNRADLVISRAGANTVWDLSQLAKASILIPLPFAAANEQEENALLLEKQGACILLSQKEATKDSLLKAVEKAIKNLPDLNKNASKFQKNLPKDSASRLVEHILSYT